MAEAARRGLTRTVAGLGAVVVVAVWDSREVNRFVRNEMGRGSGADDI